MKTIKIFNRKIDFCLRVRRFKDIKIDLPDFVDDVSLVNDDNNLNPYIKYYKGSTPFKLSLPKCKKVEILFLKKRTEIMNDIKVNNVNRFINIRLYI